MQASATVSEYIGEIRMMHTFNGAVQIPRGWMLCDGSVVNSTNYETIHGTGKYTDDQVSASPIAGKNLPNLVNKYAVGASSTTQSGASSITSVGNANHQVNLQHNHKWFDNINNSSSTDQTYDSGGNAVNVPTAAGKNVGSLSILVGNNGTATSPSSLGDSWTQTGGNTSQSVQPESIQVLFIIKVA